MKQLLLFTLAAGGLLMAGACKKKTTTTTPPTGVVVCKVNGNSWQSDDASVVYTDKNKTTAAGTSATITGDSVLLINGVKVKGSDSSSVRLNIRLTKVKTGMYTGTTTAKYGCIYASGFDFDHIFLAVLDYNGTYTVNISSVDATNKKISGTFSISMVSKSGGTNYSVTEGSFTDVVYTVK